MTDPESLANAANRLKESIVSLSETVNEANAVRDELADVVASGRRNTRLIVILSVVMTLVVALIASVVVISLKVQDLAETQRDAALCPLYTIFLESDTPQNRERARLQGQDMSQRLHALEVIRESYKALECKQ